MSKTPKLCRTRIAQDPKSHSEKRDVSPGHITVSHSSHQLADGGIVLLNNRGARPDSSCEDPGYIRILGLGWLLKVSGCVGNHRWVFVRLRIYSRGFRTWDLGFSPSEKVSDRPSVRGGNTHHCTSKQPAAGPSKDCIVDHCPRANIICIPSL